MDQDPRLGEPGSRRTAATWGFDTALIAWKPAISPKPGRCAKMGQLSVSAAQALPSKDDAQGAERPFSQAGTLCRDRAALLPSRENVRGASSPSPHEGQCAALVLPFSQAGTLRNSRAALLPSRENAQRSGRSSPDPRRCVILGPRSSPAQQGCCVKHGLRFFQAKTMRRDSGCSSLRPG